MDCGQRPGSPRYLGIMTADGESLVDRETLFAAIRRSWGPDTSADSGWSASCPAKGQCAVTALVVQDYLGGQLLRAGIGGVSHYWNAVQDEELDLTRQQFPDFTPEGTCGRTREYVLSFPGTARRYGTLRERVAAALGQESAKPAT